MDVDRPGAAVVLVAPHPAQERLPREDLAGVLGQELQQLVLHVREVQRPAADGGLVGLDVEHQRAVLDQLRARTPARPPEEVLEPRLQLARIDGSHAEVVEQVLPQLEVEELIGGDHQEQR